jgi:hypothetical protein
MPQVDVSAAFTREATRLGTLARDSGKAKQRAVGTLARRLPVEARRDMQAEYSLKARRITAGLSVTRGDGFVELRGSKRGIGLIEFAGRWAGRKSSGATAQVRRSEGRGDYGGAFITRLRGGNRQIVERAIVGGKRAERLPIRTLYGPSVAQMLRNDARRARLADVAQDVLHAEFDRLLGGIR